MKLIRTRQERDQLARNREIAAAEAEQLWRNETLQAALKAIEDEINTELDRAPIRGEKAPIEQQQLIMLRQVCNRFKKKLSQAIEDVALAKRNSQS